MSTSFNPIFSAQADGYKAAKDGIAGAECPYMFHKLRCSVAIFDAQYRPLLDAWFKGFKEGMKEKA